MVLFLLAVADACVPVLADSLPEALLKKLQPGKVSGFLCLGNVDDAVVVRLRRISTEIRRVAGESKGEDHLPSSLVFEEEGVRIGMCHGHRAVLLGDELSLGALRRRLGVDLLLSAATGRASVRASGSGLLVDPGSITGANCSCIATGRPSYTLMSLDNGKVSLWSYTLGEGGDVSFKRQDWFKSGRTKVETRDISARDASTGPGLRDSVGQVTTMQAKHASAALGPAPSSEAPAGVESYFADSTSGMPVPEPPRSDSQDSGAPRGAKEGYVESTDRDVADVRPSSSDVHVPNE